MTTEAPKTRNTFLNRVVFPLFLLVVCPPTVHVFFFTIKHLGGSVSALIDYYLTHGIIKGTAMIYFPIMFGSTYHYTLILGYALMQIGFMYLTHFSKVDGPETATGYTPRYHGWGLQVYLLSIASIVLLDFFQLVSLSRIIAEFDIILSCSMTFGLALCAILQWKGYYYPSSKDHSSSGNLLFDYFWGTELHPNVFGIDIKQFTNCRYGMMGWALVLICCLYYQLNTLGYISSGLILSVALQLIYITKFFYWEVGYFATIDIQYDRAGFYICYGCMGWLPCIYTLPGLFTAYHPFDLSPIAFLSIALLGIIAIFINYDIDRQKMYVREKRDKAKVWGRKASFRVVKYTNARNEQRESVLLTCGYWAMARHLHYFPEIMAALFWSLPNGPHFALPYFYVVYLTILLVHRSYRDDERCRNKYGAYWDQHMKDVPYRIIPYLY